MPDRMIGIYLYDGARSGRAGKLPDGREILLIVAKGRGQNGVCDYRQNGIAILDITNTNVILDNHDQIPNGFCGPANHQLNELDRLASMHPDALLRFIHQHPRTRPSYRPSPEPKPYHHQPHPHHHNHQQSRKRNRNKHRRAA